MDISWISSQAKEIHDFFVQIFYSLAVLLILVGVILDYFKLPIGGVPSFAVLVGRALVASILLIAYPQISNWVSTIADAVADHLGSANHYSKVLDAAGETLMNHSWSWTSIGDTVLSVAAMASYGILFLSVYFFDAAIIYCLVLLYIFSPLLIAFYILPQTASMTTGAFRTLFEIAAWKIVFAVMGTLLWSTALNSFEQKGQNFITLLALSLMLAFSILLTPIVVKNLISGAISNIATQTAGLAAMGITAGYASPAVLAGLAKKGSGNAYKFGYRLTKEKFNQLRSSSDDNKKKPKEYSRTIKAKKSSAATSKPNPPESK